MSSEPNVSTPAGLDLTSEVMLAILPHRNSARLVTAACIGDPATTQLSIAPGHCLHRPYGQCNMPQLMALEALMQGSAFVIDHYNPLMRDNIGVLCSIKNVELTPAVVLAGATLTSHIVRERTFEPIVFGLPLNFSGQAYANGAEVVSASWRALMRKKGDLIDVDCDGCQLRPARSQLAYSQRLQLIDNELTIGALNTSGIAQCVVRSCDVCGHFGVMPGWKLIQAAVQATELLLGQLYEPWHSRPWQIRSIGRAVFFESTRPGDTLSIQVSGMTIDRRNSQVTCRSNIFRLSENSDSDQDRVAMISGLKLELIMQ